MIKKLISLSLFIFLMAGCTNKCVLIRSEYYDITGKVLVPKAESDNIEILTETPDRPYVQIGVVKVLARWGTNKEVIDQELKRRAKAAGADALIDPEYGEDKSNDIVLCGKIVSTKRNKSAIAKTIVFTNKSTGE